MVLGSCKGVEDPQKITHPIMSLISHIESSHELALHSVGSEDLLYARELARKLASSTEILTLGEPEGEEHQVFGQITDIKLDRGGNLYVLDAAYSTVRIYDSEGLYKYSIGSPGRGPGEFFMPEDLEVDSLGRVYVIDKTSRKTIFKRVANGHELEQVITLPITPFELCSDGGTLYVHGTSSEESSNVIFTYTSDGNSLGAFGTVYESPSSVVRYFFEQGKIACTHSPGKIIYASGLLPVIHSYSLEGDIQWTARIPNFKMLNIVENKGATPDQSSVTMNVRSNAHDQIATVVPFPAKHVILQVSSFTPESIDNSDRGEGERFVELLSYLVIAQTGEAVYIGHSLPRIVAITEDHFYTKQTSPYPKITVHSYNSAGE